jgi:hypothetical protein
MNGRAVRQAFEEGVARMEQPLAAGRRIAWLSLAASVVALTATICAIFVRVIHWLKSRPFSLPGSEARNFGKVAEGGGLPLFQR